MLETQKDGYFNSDMFLVEVDKATDIFEKKYRGIFLFDNVPSRSEDDLNVERMNIGPGGKQALLRDTSLNGQIVLKINAEKMREVLSQCEDLKKNQATLVEENYAQGVT